MNTLETKLNATRNLTPQKASEYWHDYHTKYEAKHNGALFHAMIGGNVQDYVDKEVNTFLRYVRLRVYLDAKPKVIELHHVAQENKVKRYQHGCVLTRPHNYD